jgi:hypothetical protein
VVPASAWLSAPAFYQLTISTWTLWQQFQHLPGLRPGSFITILPPPAFWSVLIEEQEGMLGGEGEEGEDAAGEAAGAGVLVDPDVPLGESALYTGYCQRVEDVLQAAREGRIRRVHDNAPLRPGAPLTSMAEVLRDYFQHPEAKTATPQGVGALPRRHVEASEVRVIDKESNRLAQMIAEETNGTMGARAMLGGHDYGVTGTKERLASLLGEHMADLLAATCLPRSTLYRVLHTADEPQPATLRALDEGMRLLDPDHAEGIAGWRDILTLEALAAVLHPAPEDAQHGERCATPDEREREIVEEHHAHREERERAWMDREAARLAREERAEVVRILRRAGGVRISIDHATGRPINRGEWALLPASVRRREGRLTMDQAVADVMAEIPALGWEVPDDLVQYFERARTRERQHQHTRPVSDRGQDALEDARDRLRGRKTWTIEERDRLVRFMTERRKCVPAPAVEHAAHQAHAAVTEWHSTAAGVRLHDARSLAGVPADVNAWAAPARK